MGQMNTYGKANVRINSLSHEAKSRKKLQPCFSSIVNEVIGTIYLFIYLFIYYFIKIFCIKKHKFCSNISIRLKSIIKHTSNFHLDITPRSIKKQTTFRLNIFIRLKKHTSNFHSDIASRSIKNKQLFI